MICIDPISLLLVATCKKDCEVSEDVIFITDGLSAVCIDPVMSPILFIIFNTMVTMMRVSRSSRYVPQSILLTHKAVMV